MRTPKDVVRFGLVALALALTGSLFAQTFSTPLNNAASALAADHALGSGTLALTAGTGARFGSPTALAPIRVTVAARSTLVNGQIAPTTIQTIYQVTGRTGDTLTGLTAIEGTSDRAYRVNDVAAALVTAGMLSDLQAAILAGGTTNTVLTTGSYPDPAWITSLAAAKLTGTVAVANGGTAATTAAAARTNLGAAPLASPTFTGTVIAPTLAGGAGAGGGLTIETTTDATKGTMTVLAGITDLIDAGRVITRATINPTIELRPGGGGSQGTVTFYTPAGVADAQVLNSGGSLLFDEYTPGGLIAFRPEGIAALTLANGTATVAGTLTAARTDAGTTTTPDMLTVGHASSGTPAAGFGTAVLLRAQSSTTAAQDVARIVASWATATHASRKGRVTIAAADFTGTDREGLRVESDGTQALVSIGGGVQFKSVLSATATLDFPSTAAQTSADLTVTVTGAAVGDVVSLGLPATVAANTSFTGWVSAAGTVTIRHNNYSSAAVDPASATFRPMVTHY